MKVSKAIAIALIWASCLIFGAFSQYPASNAIKTLNVATGLPQSFISGLVQDSTGFIWIATRDGLARYDGRKFKVFRHIPGDTTTLANNIISSFYLDTYSRLWILYETGDLDVLNTTTEILVHLTKDPVFKSVQTPITTNYHIAEDTEKKIWLLANSGEIYVCNLNKRTLKVYSSKFLYQGLKDYRVLGLVKNNGCITVVTDTVMISITENQLVQKTHYSFPGGNNYLRKDWKEAYPILRNNGEIITFNDKGLNIYNVNKKNITIISLPKGKTKPSLFVTPDSSSRILFSYNSAIYIVSNTNKLSICSVSKNYPQFGYKSGFLDHSGVLWMGTNGSGLQLYDLRLSRWSAQPYVNSFFADVLQSYLKTPVGEIRKSFLHNLPGYYVRWLEDRDGKIWFSKAIADAVAKPQICFYKDGHIVQPRWFYTDTARSTHRNVCAMAFSQSGELWGFDFYLRPVHFNTLTGAINVYPSVASVKLENSNIISSLLIDKEDIFWISTALDGLYCYNKQKGVTIHYYNSELPGSLSSNQLMNMVQDSSDSSILWIASLSGGLIKFNKTTGRCRSYTTRDGLPNNTVYAVIADAKGILWCSSNKGIFSFNPKTEEVRSFISKDGLPGDEFNRYHFLRLTTGHIAFGGVEGYTVFDPLRIADDNFHPSIALTDIHINNTPSDFGYPGSPFTSAVNSLKQIVLPHYQNFLAFDFAALQYNITEKLQYRYKLEGFNEDWIYSGNESVATYTNIPPGRYIFKVNASNTAGKWSDQIKTLTITIKPPFWQTWWFVCICILVASSILYYLIQRHIAGVREEEQQKAVFELEASELKAQALRAQMNPHFIFNCLNSIKALIQEDNKIHAVIYLTTFSKLIRSQLNNALREVSLYEELQTCRLYAQLESLRFGDKIVCEFQIDESCDIHSLQVPPLIIQPFIENAIWHGILPKAGGKVTVSVNADNNGLLACKIDDDGIGREKSLLNKSLTSSTYKSKGMKLVQNRLDLYNLLHNHGGTIAVIDKKDKNNNALGTLVVITFQQQV